MSWNVERPSELQHVLKSYGGEPITVVSLRGLSHNQVWRVTFTGASLIVKAARSMTEMQFYRQIAPVLNARGVATPQLLWATTRFDKAWLVLEDIPTPLPPTRWHVDPNVLALLYRLHHVTLQSVPISPFAPAWTDTYTEAAVAYLPAAHRGHVQRKLRVLQTQSQYLFTDQCWISGDPNPLNWGVRQDGTVVLYDWERFGRGTPALDLAITIPGLGDWTSFEQVATQYLQAQSACPDSDVVVHTLVRQIALAKVWNVVEFFHLASTGQVAQTDGLAGLVQQVPAWLDAVAG